MASSSNQLFKVGNFVISPYSSFHITPYSQSIRMSGWFYFKYVSFPSMLPSLSKNCWRIISVESYFSYYYFRFCRLSSPALVTQKQLQTHKHMGMAVFQNFIYEKKCQARFDPQWQFALKHATFTFPPKYCYRFLTIFSAATNFSLQSIFHIAAIMI